MHLRLSYAVSLIVFLLLSCGGPSLEGTPGSTPVSSPGSRGGSPKAVEPPETVVLSVVGTNDVHGHGRRLAILGGYVENLRAARRADGGAVLLLDGGDMWQGTLESNLGEGAAMVRAYNALGYDAVTLGNHEFDYGPEGEHATPQDEGEARRGALLARVKDAEFPVLAANFLDRASGAPIAWPGVRPHVLLDVAGVKVGVMGLTTEEALETTIGPNVDDLEMAPLVDTIVGQAEALRAEGAEVIAVAVHAGGRCEAFDDAEDLSTCAPDEEIFKLARALPTGTVDVIVGGHTHKGVAHRVAGVPVIESFSNAVAFGRVDLTFDRRSREVLEAKIYPPQGVCTDRHASSDACQPFEYEGRPVTPHAGVLEAFAPAVTRAREVSSRSLGVTLATDFPRAPSTESPLGNLLADLMRAVRRDADVAIINAGGIRSSLAAGPLTYGALYETFPFDNRFATIRMKGSELEKVMRDNFLSDRGIYSVSGIRVTAKCTDGSLGVELFRVNGRPIRDSTELTVLVSDYLATGGDRRLVQAVEAGAPLQIEASAPIRDQLAAYLEKRGGIYRASDPKVMNPRKPRLALPGPVPIQCP